MKKLFYFAAVLLMMLFIGNLHVEATGANHLHSAPARARIQIRFQIDNLSGIFPLGNKYYEALNYNTGVYGTNSSGPFNGYTKYLTVQEGDLVICVSNYTNTVILSHVITAAEIQAAYALVIY